MSDESLEERVLPQVEEWGRRRNVATGAERGHVEGFVEAHRSGVEALKEHYKDLNEVEEDIDLSELGLDFVREHRDVYKHGVTEHIAQRGIDYLNLNDTQLNDLEESELGEREFVEMVTGATYSDAEKILDKYIQDTNRLEDFTSDELSSRIKENESFNRVRQRLQQYVGSAVENPQELVEYIGKDDVLRKDLVSPNYAAQLVSQYQEQGGLDDSLIAAQTAQSLGPEILTEKARTELLEGGGGITPAQYRKN